MSQLRIAMLILTSLGISSQIFPHREGEVCTENPVVEEPGHQRPTQVRVESAKKEDKARPTAEQPSEYSADATTVTEDVDIAQLLRFFGKDTNCHPKMLAAVDADIRQRIEDFEKQHGQFVACVHFAHAIHSLSGDILEEVKQDQAYVDLAKLLNVWIYCLQRGLVGKIFEDESVAYRLEIRGLIGDFFGGLIIHPESMSHAFDLGGLPFGNGSQGQALAVPNSQELQAAKGKVREILQELVNALRVAESDLVIQKGESSPFIKKFHYLLRYLTALSSSDLHGLAQTTFDYLEPDYVFLHKSLVALQEDLLEHFYASTGGVLVPPSGAGEVLLEEKTSAEQPSNEPKSDAAKDLSKQENGNWSKRLSRVRDDVEWVIEQVAVTADFYQNPYFYFLERLKNYQGGYAAYSMMKNKFPEEAHSKDFFDFFKMYAYAYDYARNFLSIYDSEAERCGKGFFSSYRITPMLLNYAFTASIAARYFFSNVRNLSRESLVHQTMLSPKGLEEQSLELRCLLGEYVAYAIVVPAAIGLPNLQLLPQRLDIKEQCLKLSASWLYYHFFYNSLFKRNTFFGHTEAGQWELVPKDWTHFREVYLTTIDKSVAFMGQIITSLSYSKISPEVLANLSDLSGGLIKPTAMLYVMQAFLPMMLLSPVGNFMGLSDAGVREHYKLLPDAAAQRRYGMSAAGHRADLTLFMYVCSTLGYTVGHCIGGAFHNEIISGVGSVLGSLGRGCAALGLGFDDDEEAVLDELKFKGNIFLLILPTIVSSGLRMALNPPPGIKPFFQACLLRQGYVSAADDEREYKEAMMNMVLTQLALYGFMPFYEASLLARKFKAVPTEQTIDEIIAYVMAHAKKGAVSVGVGMIGREIGGWAGQCVHNAYGPITPRVKRIYNAVMA